MAESFKEYTERKLGLDGLVLVFLLYCYVYNPVGPPEAAGEKKSKSTGSFSSGRQR